MPRTIENRDKLLRGQVNVINVFACEEFSSLDDNFLLKGRRKTSLSCAQWEHLIINLAVKNKHNLHDTISLTIKLFYISATRISLFFPDIRTFGF